MKRTTKRPKDIYSVAGTAGFRCFLAEMEDALINHFDYDMNRTRAVLKDKKGHQAEVFYDRETGEVDVCVMNTDDFDKQYPNLEALIEDTLCYEKIDDEVMEESARSEGSGRRSWKPATTSKGCSGSAAWDGERTKPGFDSPATDIKAGVEPY